MVVTAFLIPLGLLVRDLAHDRAMSDAEREAEAVARFIAVVGPDRGIEQALAALGDHDGDEFETTVIFADGQLLGATLRPGEDASRAAGGVAVRSSVDGGEAVYVPILQSDGSLLTVRVFAPDALLTRGVVASWVTLGLLGIVLVLIAAAVFDRLARSIVVPVEDLSRTAAQLGEGDLDVRVEPSGPKEIREVGAQFNLLAERVRHLLQQEREVAADLSHQLRTPLTAVRLDAEALPPGFDRDRLLEDIDDLTRHVDFVISEARREVRRAPGLTSDIVDIVNRRIAFWGALADEQDRTIETAIAAGPIPVSVTPADLETLIDALLGNVFAHTPDTAPIAVAIERLRDQVRLTVADGGPGFHDDSALERGEGSGTGLGLDIARRTAESAGGAITVGSESTLGGAVVEITLPVST